mgnify:CR=1 FL=1
MSAETLLEELSNCCEDERMPDVATAVLGLLGMVCYHTRGLVKAQPAKQAQWPTARREFVETLDAIRHIITDEDYDTAFQTFQALSIARESIN